MEQLELDIKVKSYKPLKEVACPCCKQRIRNIETRHLSRQAIRKILFDNWEALSKDLLQKHLTEPADISLAAHPDLLWALKAEAGYYGLELDDMASLIFDSWFEGRIKEFHRRGKKLMLPEISQPESKVLSGHEAKQDDYQTDFSGKHKQVSTSNKSKLSG